MAQVNIEGNTGGAVKAVNQLNTELNQTEQEQKQIQKASEKTTKEIKEGAKEGESAWTRMNNAMEVIGKAYNAVIGAASKFHEMQIKGRKENLQWQSMLNSTRASEIVVNMDKINAAFGDNIDKAQKMKMAYASAFSDVSYNVEDFGIIVQNMAQRTGKEITEVAEELQQMLLKGDMGMLEDMGLLHNADIELQKYAGSIGKAIDELTDFEVRQGQTQITMKYLNSEFNNTKPLQDTYINLTNKAMHATDGFSGVVANLTDEIFNLNSGMDNLSVAGQMKRVQKEIDEAKKIIETGTQVRSGGGGFGEDSWYGAGLEEIADAKDVEDAKKRIESANSKLLKLQNDASNIYSSKLIKDYGVRKAESKKELKGIMDQIKTDTEAAQEQLKGFMANGTLIVNENSLALMTRVQSLKTVYNEAQKEMAGLKSIKKTKAQIDAENAVISEAIAQEMAEWKEANQAKQEREIKQAEKETLLAEQRKKREEDERLEKIAKEKEMYFKLAKVRNADLILYDHIESKKADIKAKEHEILRKQEMEFQEKTKSYMLDAANNMYSGLLEGRENFLQETIALSMKRAGAEIFNDGLQGLWQGGRWALSPYPTMAAQGVATIGYSLAEIGAGLALGYAGTKIMPKVSKGSDKKDETAKDSNAINETKPQLSQTRTYLFPSEKDYLQSLQKSNSKLHG